MLFTCNEDYNVAVTDASALLFYSVVVHCVKNTDLDLVSEHSVGNCLLARLYSLRCERLWAPRARHGRRNSVRNVHACITVINSAQRSIIIIYYICYTCIIIISHVESENIFFWNAVFINLVLNTQEHKPTQTVLNGNGGDWSCRACNNTTKLKHLSALLK